MIQSSEQLNELAAALSVAQHQIDAVKRDQKSHHGKYADLAQVIASAREPLSKNGLSYVQFPVGDAESGMGLSTRLMHKSGQWLEGTVYSKAQLSDPQKMGSAITYLRRYGLMAVLGIPAEDDDGYSAKPKQNGSRSNGHKPSNGNNGSKPAAPAHGVEFPKAIGEVIGKDGFKACLSLIAEGKAWNELDKNRAELVVEFASFVGNAPVDTYAELVEPWQNDV